MIPAIAAALWFFVKVVMGCFVGWYVFLLFLRLCCGFIDWMSGG